MRKILLISIAIVLILAGCSPERGETGSPGYPESGDSSSGINPAGSKDESAPAPKLNIERVLSGHDEDGDGMDDLEDIVYGGRLEVSRKPMYVNAYYSGGYPPEDEGVCTDVIWRAFRTAGYELKQMVDRDIRDSVSSYPRVDGNPDPNIDFRRVPNLVSYFERHAASLTTEIIPNDPGNLVQWQGGDIVFFGPPLWHTGIVSDRRRNDGVPFLIHNSGPYAAENDMLTDWPSKITHHFRFPKPGS
ncbi:MAG: DUF1287 domain-containing protein [Firmicutes bacterium HGW-Firmicutes-14]|jgi:hypothetical protein|nr:MAG: DUF1287 domain-containing protein [Firmicutes bacterium HGW-Firmicutes-14]